MLSLVVVLLFTSVQSQKFDREYFLYQNIHIPSKLIYDQIKNYGVSVNIIGSQYNVDYNNASNLMTRFTSYDKTEFANADLRITANFGPYIFVEEKIQTTVTEEEVNKQKVKVTYYNRYQYFKYPINYRAVNSKNGVELFSNQTATTGNLYIESGKFRTEAEANNYFNYNKTTMLQGQINQHVENFLKGCNGPMADMYDFYNNSTTLDIFKIKKWDKDDEYNEHVKNVMSIFKSQTADEQPSVVMEKLKKDISYFSSFEGLFNPKDKKEDMLYFVNYYNLSMIHFCLDDYEKAKYYLQKLDSSDKNERETRNLGKYISTAVERTKKHFLTNTHLVYNPVKDFRLAGKPYKSDASSSAENLSASIASGEVVKDKVILAENATESIGKIAFIVEKNELQFFAKENPTKPITLTPQNCKWFKKDSVEYVSVKNNSNGPAVKQFFKVHFNSPKIKLLEYMNPSFMPDGNNIGFIKPNEEFITLIVGFGIKKKLGKYFEDCEAVSKKARDGEFGGAFSNKKIADYTALCEEYTNCK